MSLCQIDGSVVVRTTEMHSAGEPVRIVEEGYPPVEGSTLLDKRRYVREHLDHLRRFLMFEPRGHYDMYGALLVKPDHPEADIAVLFMHNEGYSTMCGHATIALGRYAVDSGLVKDRISAETKKNELEKNQKREIQVNIQAPCGLVKTFVEYSNGKSGRVRFHSVPAFTFALDIEVEVSGIGRIPVDIGYGGAYYALVKDSNLNIDVNKTSVRELTRLATLVSEAVRSAVTLRHPESPDLAFLYGTIITDGKDEFSTEPTVNLTVFADMEVDRAPTGSGVTARIAVQHSRRLIHIGQKRTFKSAANSSEYTGQVADVTTFGEFPAVVVEVSGTAYYTGSATFTAEAEDDLRAGFLVK